MQAWSILAALLALALIGLLLLRARRHGVRDDLDQQNLTTYLGMAAMSGRRVEGLAFRREIQTLIVARGWGSHETTSRLAHAVLVVKDVAPQAHEEAVAIGRQILVSTHPRA
ncbi:hypothetical protein [Labrys wisconsinensis]|uniref:Uncharacterized protein n=1 Tax=Labrys wisconsinensis TaxID=425677 RepID=A0ABU0J994_9HYPH|nr:hypothetical protein [Labrys wisconsinensis]MDQ0470842.1 hypothetical protein [Labrys wisconsinensis]